MPNEQLIKSLLIEREGYVARGKGARVRQVDEQLAFLGYKTATRETAQKVDVKETAAITTHNKTASK